ncbi:hypothetical protein F5Y14DRAFT_295550 [Nemania sp. NC0429]|nr:hypothetical protein F5Y14DRAFT_295550 [Nemania sp. NC0429]
MDPLSAIGLGAAVIQFIDFSSKLICVAREVAESSSSTTVEFADLEVVTCNLIDLNDRISNSIEDQLSKSACSQSESGNIHPITALASSCNDIAHELLEGLQKLKAGPGKWKGLVQAFRTIWNQARIEGLRLRLNQHHNAMQSALIVSLREQVSLITDQLQSYLKPESAVDRLKIELLEAIRKSSADDVQTMAASRSFSAILLKMTEEERNTHFQSLLLEQLQFHSQVEREHGIALAHEETFRWVFAGQYRHGFENKRWSDFSAWLRTSDDPLYWVTGKAGSGKSTLMKFIIDSPQCANLLATWGQGLPVLLMRFYFWNSGAEIQCSQEGLLRSLLYDALGQHPELIRRVFPQRWNRWILFGHDPRSWTLAELTSAFRNLIDAAKETYKICMFVDGLDEFDGSLEELISLIKKSVASPNVKACVSSRPWVIFEESFARRPSLMLEDLTYPDILAYTSFHFERNSGFTALQARERQFSSTLIESVAIKSRGVFLWVTLVVRSLLAGLSNFDRVSDLQRRLEELPVDLENFYDKMLDSIDPFYKPHAGQLFRLVAAAKGRLTAIGLSFADDDDITTQKLLDRDQICAMRDDEALARLETVRRRLNSRCKGLIEIPSSTYSEKREMEEKVKGKEYARSSGMTAYGPSATVRNDAVDVEWDMSEYEAPSFSARRLYPPQNSSSQRKAPELMADKQPPEKSGVLTSTYRQVAYLHRTVRDYLDTREAKAKVDEMAGAYEPYAPLAKSCLLMVKTYRSRAKHDILVNDLVQQTLEYLAETSSSSDPLRKKLLDELERCVNMVYSCDPACINGRVIDRGRHWASECVDAAKSPVPVSFLTLVATHNFYDYISGKISTGRNIIWGHDNGKLLRIVVSECGLYPSFCAPELFAKGHPAPSGVMVRHLLQNGSDPNAIFDGVSTWSCFWERCLGASDHLRHATHPGPEALAHWADLTELFIKAGADPRVNKDSEYGSRIREAFSWCLPTKARQLEKLLNASKTRWGLSGRFIVPIMKQSPSSTQDTTPLPILNRLAKASMDTVFMTDYYLTPRRDQTRRDETRRDQTRRDQTRRDQTRRDESRRNEIWRNETWRNETRHNETRHNETWRNETRHNRDIRPAPDIPKEAAKVRRCRPLPSTHNDPKEPPAC